MSCFSTSGKNTCVDWSDSNEMAHPCFLMKNKTSARPIPIPNPVHFKAQWGLQSGSCTSQFNSLSLHTTLRFLLQLHHNWSKCHPSSDLPAAPHCMQKTVWHKAHADGSSPAHTHTTTEQKIPCCSSWHNHSLAHPSPSGLLPMSMVLEKLQAMQSTLSRGACCSLCGSVDSVVNTFLGFNGLLLWTTN